MTYYIAIAAISLSLNILLLWYVRQVLTKLWFLADNKDELQQRLNFFEAHLASVYELETFYGDATLEALLEHSRDISEYIKQYEEIYSLVQEEEEEEPANDNEEEEV